ncbi:hypothetical protein CERSUDRAFT_113358 [Gelatoporia subvermispora B]|uniref:Carboxylic ester hydrolase n=1 Tax=Ceriporiopsis subvermispora (strain B) TaxID=914234 RepID=M2PP23_CERS8|nr:hypothetical protein CERSUDRAFT_113358 [Gelatoporia subvermispora B]
MVGLVSLVSTLLLASSIWALPAPPHGLPSPLKLPLPEPNHNLFCIVPFPVVQKLLCPRQGTSSPTTVSTPLGTAQGASDSDGAARFSVKYGSASRWQESSVVSSWALPNGATDPTALPLTCPQNTTADSTMSEDCLSMILYVPSSVKPGSNAPALLWIHGGSFIVGSATDPGLDGSALAAATESVVAVVQYRLGALGFMDPSGNTNLAVKDIVTALQFLQKVLPSFGGDTSKITLAGQSSGANMIRALLAVPSAESLFQSAILQSDTMDYGLLNMSIQETLQDFFNSQINCDSTDTECLTNLSLDDILYASQTLSDDGGDISAAAGLAEPIRPVKDGSFITSPLDSTAPFPHVSKPIILSTVLNEAMPTIYSEFTDPIDSSTYTDVVNITFGTPRTERILTTAVYEVPQQTAEGTTADARPQLSNLGTDQVWRCPTWTFARNWVQNGGQVFVGLYVVGATYPGNDLIPQCLEDGAVCHQDDIEIVFGTVPSPNTAQVALTKEMQARYSSFLRTGNPNTDSFATWTPATTDDVHPLLLGGSGEASVGQCTTSYWGDFVQYDYQVFDI